MKLNDEDKYTLQTIAEELKITVKMLDMLVQKQEQALLMAQADDKEAVYSARQRLEGARILRNAYKTTVLELSKKSK